MSKQPLLEFQYEVDTVFKLTECRDGVVITSPFKPELHGTFLAKHDRLTLHTTSHTDGRHEHIATMRIDERVFRYERLRLWAERCGQYLIRREVADADDLFDYGAEGLFTIPMQMPEVGPVVELTLLPKMGIMTPLPMDAPWDMKEPAVFLAPGEDFEPAGMVVALPYMPRRERVRYIDWHETTEFIRQLLDKMLAEGSYLPDFSVLT
jgi:hypothetical protein